MRSCQTKHFCDSRCNSIDDLPLHFFMLSNHVCVSLPLFLLLHQSSAVLFSQANQPLGVNNILKLSHFHLGTIKIKCSTSSKTLIFARLNKRALKSDGLVSDDRRFCMLGWLANFVPDSSPFRFGCRAVKSVAN